MKIYFEDGPLSKDMTKMPPNMISAIDASYGVTNNIRVLETFKEREEDEDISDTVIYTNDISALNTRYAWNDELNVPEIYIRIGNDIEFKPFIRIDNLTKRVLRKEDDIAKLYLAGEFRASIVNIKEEDNPIKQELERANKYDDVKEVLIRITMNNSLSYNYPVDPFTDEDGTTKWRIDGNEVKFEAYRLLYYIDGLNKSDFTGEDFSNLRQYVTTRTNILLHNYTVSLSHRNEPKTDMDLIRTWEVLDNLLYCLGDDNWRIPDGWKRK